MSSPIMFSFHSRKLLSLSLAPTRSEEVEVEGSDMMERREKEGRGGEDAERGRERESERDEYYDRRKGREESNEGSERHYGLITVVRYMTMKCAHIHT